MDWILDYFDKLWLQRIKEAVKTKSEQNKHYTGAAGNLRTPSPSSFGSYQYKYWNATYKLVILLDEPL